MTRHSTSSLHFASLHFTFILLHPNLRSFPLFSSHFLSFLTCPSVGVLFAIFENQPDLLPQIVALAVRSGNGLVIKGGYEMRRSSGLLHSIMADAVYEASEGKVSENETMHVYAISVYYFK